ncbi:MAG: M48 family metallopeptidase [Cellvibrionaceae bacterium]
MKQFEATLYGDESSSRQIIIVSVNDEGQLLNPVFSGLSFSDFSVSPRVGNSARHLTLPDGRALESIDNDIIDDLCHDYRPQKDGFLHVLEANLLLALVASVLLVIGGGVFVKYGIPALSKPIAKMMPVSLDEKMAEQALIQMDKVFFEPSELDVERKEELHALFDSLIPKSQHTFNLVFRNSQMMGANAFALPDGTIIFTDQIIALADNDQMIAAVMLHEIGHVEERHAMESIVQQAGLSAIILLVSGDVNTASSLVFLLPTILLQSSYSQEKEWSADTFALDAMASHGIDPNHFADMMEALSESHRFDDSGFAEKNDSDTHVTEEAESEIKTETEMSTEQINEEYESDTDEQSIFDYFSTHPPTQKRIDRFREAAN